MACHEQLGGQTEEVGELEARQRASLPLTSKPGETGEHSGLKQFSTIIVDKNKFGERRGLLQFNVMVTKGRSAKKAKTQP
jgi:hypothetical protein